MGFYNVQNGDAPYLKYLADHYAMSDNFHQSVNGGTGANHIMFGHGDMIWFSDGKGNAAPPHNMQVAQGTANAGIVDEIENPNPAANTNNWYTEDGYGGGSFGSASFGGGSYTNCADTTQPGVAPIVNYLKSLPTPVDPTLRKRPLLSAQQLQPRILRQRQQRLSPTPTRTTPSSPFRRPPFPASATTCSPKHLLEVLWRSVEQLCPDPYQLNYGAIGKNTDEYCNICNPFQYDTSIMAKPAVRTAHIQDTANLYSDIKNGTLPAVSIVKPSGLVDGHPPPPSSTSSKASPRKSSMP